MKLVINSKRVYLHKNDLKRRNLRKTRVKTFTEWRQDSNTPGHSAACDDAIHEECMKLIGLPTSVNNSDVAPLLEGGRLFSEVLGVGETPRIFTVKRRKRKPPEQAANQVDGNFNGENLLLNSSSELNLACDNTNEEEPPVRNEDSNATTIKNDAINNEYKDDGAKNDLLNINDGVTSILIDSDPMSITDEVKPIINEHKDITTVNNVAINDLFNINDEVNSVPIDSDPTPFNDESLLIYNEPKDSSLDKNNTANDLFNISNEDNNSMIIDFDALPVNNDVMPIKDVSKNDLLNINDRDSNLMPIDNDALTTNDEAIRTINDPKDIHVVNDVAKKESSNIDEEDMPIDSDKMSINKEPRGDTMTRNKIIEDDLLNSSENLPTDDKNNLNSVLEDVIDKMSPTDTKNDQITNSTNSLPIAAIDNSDNVEDKDMVGNDSNNDKEVASSSLEFCTDSNRISKGVKATTEIISVDNNTESIPKNKEQSTVDLDKIDEDKEDCILVNNKESELIDLTCFNANKGPNAVVDQALDLTFYNENKDPNSLDNNSCIDLTFYNDSEEQKMVIDTIISQDNSIIDLTSYDNKVSLADAIKAEQSRILDIIKTNNTLANLKQEPSTSKYVKPRIVIKMEVEPQASTSDMDASFMKLVRRKGKRRQADGEECEEEESTRRQNKTKGRLEYISMADLAKNVGDEDDGEDDEEMSIAQTYAEYKPRKLTYGRKHPDPVVETASLSSVEPADVTYCLSLPDDTIRRGLLSALQLEAVVYASQAHEKLLPDGSRAGFLIGDGAGVGKGRTVAGIAFDNYLKGRKRALWFSVSRDLKYDAERDLRDIGAPHITAYNIVEMKYDDDISSEINGDVEEGVIFSTYMSLVSKNNSGKKYSNRLDQLLQWCGPDFEGVIIFDECHKAKNLHTAQTQTGKNVLELQNRLPKARVVYASATGASEPHNMAYMVRLGIWGEGTPFKDFGDFNRAVEKRGVSAMELVAMDIKQRGVYIARQLSFQGVTVRIIHVPMNEDFKKVYDDSTKLWSKARIKFIAAIDQNSATISPKQIGNIWRQFWATHQRFFKYLCIAAKVEAAVQCASAAVRAGSCAVLGLQGTGEARTLDYMQHCDTDLTDFISTAEGVFQALVEKQFPTEDYGTKNKKPKLSSQSQCSLSYSESMREELLLDIKKLGARLPKNTLDELIDKLGGPSKVAEMTGRIGRMVHRNGGTVYESRTWGLIKQENVNMAEKQLFMDGKKDIAIISEAASSGISLQSDRRALNKKPRVHITLELPWSADQAVQQFGRTHRSNQVNAPEYIFLISDLAGERRFASTVAKRLESLGALTHGDRRATETRDLSQFNIDNKYGRLALSKMMGAITGTDPDHEVLVSPPTNYPGDFISDVTNALREVQFYEERNYDTSVFLNRILGIPVDLQNALFQYFTETLAAVVQLAKRNGKFDMGILDLDSSSGRRVQRLTSAAYCRQHATGSAVVVLHTLLSQRGLDWAQAEKIANSKSGHERTFYRTRAGKNKQIIMCISVFSNVQNSVVWVYSPSTGQAKETQLLEDIKKNHSKVTKLDVARAEWDKQYNRALKSCRHEQCKDMSICMMSRIVRTYFILSGSLLSVWTQVEDILLSGRLLSKKERAAAAVMKIIRVNIDDGHKIIGILIPKKHVARLQEELSRDPKDLPDPTKDLPQTKQAIDKKPAVSLPSHSKENRPTNVLPHNPPSRSKDDMLNE